ncbi:sensor histidine kinase [Paenibacillus senegalensis]|uniref:sensor histidine kinase n=1 Tax=Paenibacillus senegalensis TaxID=1465766 RepID=UPI00138AD245|nr:HAMP domain-containing sensor histidine kinase [Paenibacillus senegalensis]
MPTIEFSLGEDGITEHVEVEVSDSLSPIGSIVVQTSEMFSLDIDSNGGIVAVHSTFGLSDHVYELAAREALNQKNGRSPISWQGRQWRYTIAQMKLDNNVPYKRATPSVEASHKITFLDVTESYASLTRLRTTLLSVGGAVLIVLFLISYGFANRAVRPIRDAWVKQKQFVSDASHELKTPLSILNANMGVLLENRQETIESQLKWLDYMQRGIDRMTYLIHDLLRLARLEDRHHQPHLRSLDLSLIASDVLAPFEAAAAQKQIAFSHSIAAGILLKGDEEEIRQLLLILLDNAVKYANEGGQINFTLTQIKSQIQIEIANTGPGISAEDLPHVFDRFYRADASRKHEDGSFGLGLAIAKSIIEQAGGRITVRSQAGAWTTFTCTFG